MPTVDVSSSAALRLFDAVVGRRTICSGWRLFATKADTHRWHQRQSKDPYVKLRHEHNYRARSAFKLIEIDDKFRLLRPGSVVVELGAAPGAWSQVVVERANCLSQVKDQPIGFVLGVDLQPIAPLSGAEFISMGDITLKETQDAIRQRLDDRLVDLVLSDMAPNPTGSAPTDHIRIVKLCAIALRLAVAGDVVRLKQGGGAFVCKLWGGVDTDELVAATRKYFTKVNIYKPPASRDDSSELFIVAKNFIGIQNE
uniref:rRNA methyltransferase 2, mitochondrial n=1 Tax=Plectus sambesii TaxID=2011161 RepID=A0A914WH09_9BILA